MVIYNVTCSVDRDISEEWISWMRDKHCPELLKTGLFSEFRILKVLSHDDPDTLSFAVQYYSESIDDVNEYIKTHAARLRDDVQKRYGDRVIAYRTLLEDV